MSIITVKKLNVDGEFSNTYLVTYENGMTPYVPHNEDNRHYQEILEWVAEGNVIEEAD